MNTHTRQRAWWAGMLLGIATCPLWAEEAVKGPDNRTVDYTIIVTGHELLTGVYPDVHTHFVTRTLRPFGWQCVGSMCVDDEAAEIRRALEFACPRSQLVIVTGGLGPTNSDITREVLSEFTGIPLEEHPEVLQAMETRFHTPRAELRANLRRQTRVPTRGSYLNNASGSAVGLVFETDTVLIVALPGPPRELQPMVRDELVPELVRRFGGRAAGCSMTVRFIGIGQSQIDQTMKEHIQLPDDVLETTQFEAGRVDFTFTLPGDRPEDYARLEQLRRDFHEQLGEFIYADDETTTLEDCVAQRLADRREKIVLVEVGSGGGLAAALGCTRWARDALAGAFVAAHEQHLPKIIGVADQWQSRGADAAGLEWLAAAAAARTDSQWSLVVGAPKPDPRTGAPSVDVCIRYPDGTSTVARERWPGATSSAQALIVSGLLDRLRRAVSAASSARPAGGAGDG